MEMGKLLAIGLLAGVGALVAKEMPSLKRYLKLKGM